MLLYARITHVWQTQTKGEWYLVLHRHPWCRYDYALKPGWRLERYGIEQQAEIVRHALLLRRGAGVPGAPPAATYENDPAIRDTVTGSGMPIRDAPKLPLAGFPASA